MPQAVISKPAYKYCSVRAWNVSGPRAGVGNRRAKEVAKGTARTATSGDYTKSEASGLEWYQRKRSFMNLGALGHLVAFIVREVNCGAECDA
jgi:hypothetical protein